MADIGRILKHLHPNADFRKDIILRDDRDGKGAYIKEWNLPIQQPTIEQIMAKEVEAETAYQLKDQQKSDRKNALLTKLKIDQSDLETLKEILQ